MHDNMHVQTVAKNFSRSREREPSISGTFVRLNMLNYKRAAQSDQGREVIETELSKDKLRVRRLGASSNE